MEIADSPVMSVISHKVAVLQDSLQELEDQRSKNKLPDFCFLQEGHVDHDTRQDADGSEDIYHVILGLSNSALIKEEIKLDIFELWKHHSHEEEECESVPDLSVLQGIADELDIQAEFLVVCHLAMWDIVV